MYCPKCGEKITDGVGFCSKCGMILDNISHQNVSEKLKTAKKVSNYDCPKCGYSGNMKFVKYRWNPIKRYALLIVITLIADAMFVPRVHIIILFIIAGVIVRVYDTIGSMPKYLQCPNCDADVYVVNMEEVRNNPTYIKPLDIGTNTHTNKDVSDKVWKYLSIALVLILLLCAIVIQRLTSEKKENFNDNTKITVEPMADDISEIEEQKETEIETIHSDEVLNEENMGVDEGSASVYTDEMYIACLNVHGTLMNYLNGNTSVQFSIDDLRMIYENYSIIEKQNLYEAPLNVEEYVAMRDGPTIRFDYEDYVCIYWTLDTDEVIVGFMPEE